MQIHCFAGIPLDQDEPVPAIRRFVQLLRNGAVTDGRGEIDIKLIGISACAKAAIKEFRAERTRGESFARSLEIAEELTELRPSKIKSLHFMLTAGGFRWKGSNENTGARLALLDGKSFRRKTRFHFSAHLTFKAKDLSEPFIATMLDDVAEGTGIGFEIKASLMHLQPGELGRATPHELFATVLSWQELIESVGKTVRERVLLAGIPHLMTADQAHRFIFNPAKHGKSVRVDFARISRRWLRQTFPEYKPAKELVDGHAVQRPITEDLVSRITIEKKPGAFSKEFTAGVGIGFTSPRFAPSPDRPLKLAVQLFRFFGRMLPLKWTYRTEADLHEALNSAGALLKEIMPVFEAEAVKMQNAYKRSLEEFEGPRELSAQEAYQLVLPSVRAWAADAGLTMLASTVNGGEYSCSARVQLPSLTENGRSGVAGSWSLMFHSRERQEGLNVKVPCRGIITKTVHEQPLGRYWPSDGDKIFREGWIDSTEALRIATKVAREHGAKGGIPALQYFELSSQHALKDLVGLLPSERPTANPSPGIAAPPLKQGTIPMETNWRISFSASNGVGRTITWVKVPAYGQGTPAVEVHTYDKSGVSIRPSPTP